MTCMMRLLLRDMARPTRNWQGMVRPTPSRQPSPYSRWEAVAASNAVQYSADIPAQH